MSVTAAQVQALTGTRLSQDAINALLPVAAEIRSGDLAGAGLSASRLDEIEKWLAAHVVALRDRTLRASVREAPPVRVQIRSAQARDGLRETEWGRMAIALDTSGTLARLSAPARAVLRVLRPLA